ncbi:MAG: peptidoglycan-binding protein, partial [Paracoccaceae bacterium]
MGYPSTGQLTDYEKGFLLTSYRRALAGGPVTNQQIAANPMGPKGLLTAYRDEMAGVAAPQVTPSIVVVAPEAAPVAPAVTEEAAVAEPALPNFMGGGEQLSLASHCNTVSLLTNSNGGFTTLASMNDAGFALNEQFCLARTYAIAKGEELAGKVQGFTPQQIAQQCAGFGPAMKDYVAALSLKPQDEVLKDVGGFVLKSGMSPAQLSGTAKICLSVGYRTDNLDVAIGSALLLTVLGEGAYGELMGHHLAQGFGASRRPDLALAWYEMGLDAVSNGAEAVFAPGQPERNDLIRKAAFTLTGNTALETGGAQQNEAAPLPVFAVDQ